jgi:tetratricopeptide (TPR) repeat protein
LRPEQIEELFLAAIELPEAERGAYLNSNCGADQSLRETLDRLLRADQRAEKNELWLGSALNSEARNLIQSESIRTGQRLGAYRILRQVGAGGMGVVYEAVRDDREFEKRVAIKLVHVGLAGSPKAVEQFRQERQILANLEHPFIARLMDGGTSPDGYPYLVMEFVEGLPLVEAAGYLNGTRRLQLFRRICEAVDYAHKHGVIHLDLKPANIRVASDGTPRVLDFGVAAWVTAERAARGGYTAKFASPEQKAGGPVSIASDVFALGVVLSALLPERDRHAEFAAIVSVATHPDPLRRYASAAALADDVLRYEEHRPVTAQPRTPIYRARKFVRRHSWFSALAVVIAVAAIVGAMVVRHQSRIAEQRLENVRKIADTKEFQPGGSLAIPVGATTVRSTVDARAVESFEKLLQESPNDAGIQRDLATAYQRLALVQGTVFSANLGDRKTARVTMEKALRLNDILFDANPANVPNRTALVDTLGYLGRMSLSDGDPRAAADLHERAWKRSAELIELGPSADESYLSAARLAYLLGIDYGGIGYAANLGRPDRALELHLQSLRMLEAWAKLHPNKPNTNLQFALREQILAVDLMRLHDFQEAEIHARRAIELLPRDRPAIGRPGDPRTWCTVRFHYAFVLAEEGKPALAAAALRDAVRVAQALVDGDPRNVRARTDRAVIEGLLGRVEKSPSRLQSTITELEDLLRSDPDHAEVRGALTLQHLWLGDLAAASRHWAGAIQSYSRAAEVARETSRAHPEDANAAENLNTALKHMEEARSKQF